MHSEEMFFSIGVSANDGSSNFDAESFSGVHVLKTVPVAADHVRNGTVLHDKLSDSPFSIWVVTHIDRLNGKINKIKVHNCSISTYAMGPNKTASYVDGFGVSVQSQELTGEQLFGKRSEFLTVWDERNDKPFSVRLGQ